MQWKSPSGRELPKLGGAPLIMGILNVTDDSFSDGGMFSDLSCALSHAREMLEAGADIIDIGAESTRPNARKISAEEELARLIPAIKAVRTEFPHVAISVDTYKPEVARLAINAGADIINDVYLKRIEKKCPMARLAAELGVPLIATHNSRGEVKRENFFSSFISDMREIVEVCEASGLDKNSLILDAGVGFGKSVEENFELIARMRELRALGYPILVGVSRKSSLASVVGKDILKLDDTTATISAMLTFAQSADIIRVHNVEKNLAAVKLAMQLLKRNGRNNNQ